MRLMAYLILFSLVVLIVWFASILKNLLFPSNMEKRMKESLQEVVERDNKNWNNNQPINDMAELYMKMVCKHGPDSDEAKAFRFGTDSRLVRSLHDNGSLDAFNAKADIIDRVYRETKS